MNPYVKIAIASCAAVYITPPIFNRFVVPEIDGDTGAMRNTVTEAGITGIVTAAVYVLLSMATGKA